MSTQWVAVRTNHGAELRVERGISAARIPSLGVWERVPVKRRRRRDIVKLRAVFPRYVFAQLEPSLIGRVLEIDGVADVLRTSDSRPGHISEEVIEALRKAERVGVFDYTGVVIKPDDNVRVVNGVLAGLIAKVKRAPSRKRIELIGNFSFRIVSSVDRLERVG